MNKSYDSRAWPVQWWNFANVSDGGQWALAVAASTDPRGPFELVTAPVAMTHTFIGDFTVFVDEDDNSTAWLFIRLGSNRRWVNFSCHALIRRLRDSQTPRKRMDPSSMASGLLSRRFCGDEAAATITF